MRLATTNSPDMMNPFGTWSSFGPLVKTYDSLAGVDAQRYPDRTDFAKEWSVAKDSLTWTFKIWRGMRWSDGQPATARDAAFTYDYLLGSMGKPDELNIGQNNTNGLEQIGSVTAIDDETCKLSPSCLAAGQLRITF
ncbi:ABC transporter substrate-binding protein [Mesorhizobium sp. M0571]|uniref:ABC transporter substrate-binding protein n=1 Tax=Mesorhizobium sp. M0571 TaxID=2956960 RepID=UPI003338399C